MRETGDVLFSGMATAWERLNDPKNTKKGDFPESIIGTFNLLAVEVEELAAECTDFPEWERVWQEAGDVIAFASIIANIAREQLERKELFYPEVYKDGKK